MTNNPSQKLLADIEDFLSETGMSPHYFGKACAGNSELVRRLRGGGRVVLETEQKARAFMEYRRFVKAVQEEAAQ